MQILLTSSKGIQITNAGMVSFYSENSTVILIAWFYLMPQPFPGTYITQKFKTGIYKLM